MFARIAVLASALALLGGCGNDGGASGTDAGPPDFDSGGVAPTVEIGTGESAFVPIAASGAALELVMGPQGGWHVLLTCRFTGLSPDGLLLRYDVGEAGRDAMWNMTAEYALTRDRVTPDGTGFVRVGDRAVFDITGPADVVGKMLTVRACLEPPGGATPVCDSRLVQIVDEIP